MALWLFGPYAASFITPPPALLTRALNTLARLRGVTVETLSATVTRAVIGEPRTTPGLITVGSPIGPISERTTTQIAASRVALRSVLTTAKRPENADANE